MTRDCIKDVMDQLQPEDFYLRQNREIFETIYSMFIYSKPIDGVTVAREMEKAGVYREDTTGIPAPAYGGDPNRCQCARSTRASSGTRPCCARMAKAAGDIAAMVQEGCGNAGEILDLGGAEDLCHPPGPGLPGDGAHVGVVVEEVMDQLARARPPGPSLPGLSTGLSAVDRKINGLNKSDLHPTGRPARYGQDQSWP
ncbi:MAG: DnaB-like helicase N-terminal domain-containing protein [Oscillospiraceae bacterium]